jgi:hypothetical protein
MCIVDCDRDGIIGQELCIQQTTSFRYKDWRAQNLNLLSHPLHLHFQLDLNPMNNNQLLNLNTVIDDR